MIICSFIVYATEPEIAKFVDPSIAILSVFVLMYLTYPYCKFLNKYDYLVFMDPGQFIEK